MVIDCYDRILLAHSANFIKLTVMVVIVGADVDTMSTTALEPLQPAFVDIYGIGTVRRRMFVSKKNRQNGSNNSYSFTTGTTRGPVGLQRRPTGLNPKNVRG